MSARRNPAPAAVIVEDIKATAQDHDWHRLRQHILDRFPKSTHSAWCALFEPKSGRPLKDDWTKAKAAMRLHMRGEAKTFKEAAYKIGVCPKFLYRHSEKLRTEIGDGSIPETCPSFEKDF